MISLYQHQLIAKEEVTKHFSNGHTRVLLQMPTGAGKTRTFCSIISDWFSREDQFRCILVAHRDELIRQIGSTLDQYGIEYGVIKSKEPRDLSFQVQIASINTLKNVFELDNQVNLVVIDEAHHTGAKSYNELFKRFPRAFFLGATATPCRTDGQVLADFYNKIVVGPSIKDLINDKKLAPVQILRPQHEIEGIDQVSIKGNDYDEAELANFMNRPEIRAELVRSYLKYCYGKKGIVYAVDINHAIQICADYHNQGIEATYIVSKDESNKESERIKRVRDFKNGEVKILVNVGIFTEGFDCPDADFVQLARPTKSIILYLQMVGRALRRSEKKKHATVLDNAGVTLEHGSFVNVDYDWEAIFKNGLDNRVLFQNQSSSSEDRLAKDPVEIQEGSEELIAETYGLNEDERIVDFFSVSLRKLYEHIKTIRIISKNGYMSESTIDAVKLLEPHLYGTAAKNLDFFDLIEESIDAIQIELNALLFEGKRIGKFLVEEKTLINDNGIRQIVQAAKTLMEAGVDLNNEQLKIIQEKVKLEKENIIQIISGDFNSNLLEAELDKIEIKRIKLENAISDLNIKLEKIKEYASKGLLAENEFYKTLDIDDEIIKEVKKENSYDLDFQRFNKERLLLLLKDTRIANSVIIEGVFKKVLQLDEDSIPIEIENLYVDPMAYYKQAGMGPHKANTIKKLIEHYGNLDEKSATMDSINKQFKTNIKYTNDLKSLSDLLLSNLNDVQTALITRNSVYNFFQIDKELTYNEISNTYNVKNESVKGIAKRLKDSNLIEEKVLMMSRVFKKETKNKILKAIEKTNIKEVSVFSEGSLTRLNQEYKVNFSLRTYAMIFEIYLESGTYLISDPKLHNIYFTQQKVSSLFHEILMVILSKRNQLSFSIDITSLNKFEKEIIEFVIKMETKPFDIISIKNKLKILFDQKGQSKKMKLIEVLNVLGKWSSSSEIFAKCEELYPGEFPNPNTISSDYLTKMGEFKGESDKKFRGKKYALKKWSH